MKCVLFNTPQKPPPPPIAKIFCWINEFFWNCGFSISQINYRKSKLHDFIVDGNWVIAGTHLETHTPVLSGTSSNTLASLEKWAGSGTKLHFWMEESDEGLLNWCWFSETQTLNQTWDLLRNCNFGFINSRLTARDLQKSFICFVMTVSFDVFSLCFFLSTLTHRDPWIWSDHI